MDTDLSAAVFCNLLANTETDSNTFLINFFCAFKFLEFLKKSIEILLCYPCTSIDHVYFQLRLNIVIVHYDLDFTSVSEFDRVPRQINQELLESYLIPK